MALPPEPDPTPRFQRLELHDLFRIAQWQDQIPWQPFHEGVEIHRLYGDGSSGPSAALIRFRPGGQVPWHVHTGFEHIIVLHGTQRDQNSTAAAGTLMINTPSTAHSVTSDDGCIVLAIYEASARFSNPSAATVP